MEIKKIIMCIIFVDQKTNKLNNKKKKSKSEDTKTP